MSWKLGGQTTAVLIEVRGLHGKDPGKETAPLSSEMPPVCSYGLVC